jgi:hypothetical protein
MLYSRRLMVVRLPSFPNSASVEMSVRFSLLSLGIEWHVIQIEPKGGEATQFTQLRESRDVREIIFKTTNGKEYDTVPVKG